MELQVRVVIGETISPDGKKTLQTQWQKAEGDINIGSVKKPKNKDMVEFRWVRANPLSSLFG